MRQNVKISQDYLNGYLEQIYARRGIWELG